MCHLPNPVSNLYGANYTTKHTAFLSTVGATQYKAKHATKRTALHATNNTAELSTFQAAHLLA